MPSRSKLTRKLSRSKKTRKSGGGGNGSTNGKSKSLFGNLFSLRSSKVHPSPVNSSATAPVAAPVAKASWLNPNPVGKSIAKNYTPEDQLTIATTAGLNRASAGLQAQQKKLNKHFANIGIAEPTNNEVNAVLRSVRSEMPVVAANNNLNQFDPETQELLRNAERNEAARNARLAAPAQELANSGEAINMMNPMRKMVNNAKSKAQSITGTRRKSGGGGCQSRGAVIGNLRNMSKTLKKEATAARNSARSAIRNARKTNETAKVLNNKAKEALKAANKALSKRR